MRINIQARGFELTEALRLHTERRLQFAIDWASDEVRTVKVRFSDINGPRGGNDKCCTIQIPIVGHADLIIKDIEADLYVAIDKAADRIEHTLSRKLERVREFQHQRISASESNTEAEQDEQHSTYATQPIRARRSGHDAQVQRHSYR
ncbi:HPF/RaiA family ribosome-associated protein [Undibacterium sp.]|uniref:HPF/RaiA family ribosome-associated protein n=1 Tax=Undibacterium sp. TaxID=1914977 RepID=UPI0025F95A43|nr:HPF/RaiA family ribosome-associated protein [Undibacterium sp.]